MGWKNRTKFREKYINPLLKSELLVMTIPEKPTSSKQKYKLCNMVKELVENK